MAASIKAWRVLSFLRSRNPVLAFSIRRSSRVLIFCTTASMHQRRYPFQALARFDVRFRWLIVAFWILFAIASARFLPSLASVTQSSNAQFLPSSAPSQHAADLATPFQTTNIGATALLVASRSDGALTTADDAAIDQVEQATGGRAGAAFAKDYGGIPGGKGSGR